MRVAIVHYWLVGMRGGERVLEELCRLYPQAHIYTHVSRPDQLSALLRQHRIVETFIARLPGGRKFYKSYLPLMPLALECLDLTEYDLVISSEAGPAKGVLCAPDALHICYCHSPMRYIWDQFFIYRARAGFLQRLLMPLLSHRLRIWDTASATRPDHIVANSGFVAQRIRKAWGRRSSVIYPPVNVGLFRRPTTAPEDFYLYAGELISYKRPDLVVEAFNQSGRQLRIIGEGPERKKLEPLAGPNIEFLGRVPFDTLKDNYARCRALVFPGVEDFGMVPVEVMASGRPVIAFAQGGAEETVVDGVTGVHFHEQTVEALEAAIDRFVHLEPTLSTDRIIEHAARFDTERFRNAFLALVGEHLSGSKS